VADLAEGAVQRITPLHQRPTAHGAQLTACRVPMSEKPAPVPGLPGGLHQLDSECREGVRPLARK
jgi:hypothetical protein